jgi:hypothetical protein
MAGDHRVQLTGERTASRLGVARCVRSASDSTLSVMSTPWQYECIGTDDIRPAVLGELMKEMGAAGWELVSAQIHKVSAPGADAGGVRMMRDEDRCTMVWQKPAV